MLCASFSNAQPVHESFETATGVAVAAIVDKPTGTSINDLLVVLLAYEKGSAEVISPPVGWTLIIRNDNTTDAGQSIYYKVAGAAEPGSYSFGLTEGSKWAIGCSRISNVNSTNPISIQGSSTGNSDMVTAPSVTTAVNQSLVLCYYTNKKASTYTPDLSTTELYDTPNTVEGAPSGMLAVFSQGIAGATGDKDATSSDVEAWSGVQVAIEPPSTLPIELLFFDAHASNKLVELSWSTASETNNDFFTIEKSTDGVSFEIVQLIDGAGHSNQPRNYKVIDADPWEGSSYYRLKQTDFDGAYEYSKLVGVQYQSEPKLNVYQTSDAMSFYLSMSGVEGQTVNIQLYNPVGALVYSNEIAQLENHMTIPFDLSGQLSSGVYFVTATAGHELFSTKIVIR